LGKSGRAIIDALIAGESDPAKLAALARPGIRSKLHEALAGRIRRHHRFMLRLIRASFVPEADTHAHHLARAREETEGVWLLWIARSRAPVRSGLVNG
jgi:hypothetical protein